MRQIRRLLKAFKNQLLSKTSGNPVRFPNVQHKLRYPFQPLAGKARRTMKTAELPSGNPFTLTQSTPARGLEQFRPEHGQHSSRATGGGIAQTLRWAGRGWRLVCGLPGRADTAPQPGSLSI